MLGSLADTVAARARRRPLGLAGVATGGLLLAALALTSLLRPTDAEAQPLEAGGVPIVSVALADGDAVIAQTEPRDGVIDHGHVPVELLAVTVDDRGQRVKLVPRPGVVEVVDVGYPDGAGRMAASENGAQTPATTAGFDVAAQRVLASSDLRDYLRADDPDLDGSAWGHDLDVVFDRPLTGDHYLVISERNGNSSLRLTALDGSALPYPAGRPIEVEPPYGWNTGYAPGDTTPAQPVHLSVVDVETLLASTATGGGVEPAAEISGLRLETDDGADVNVTVFVDESSPDAELAPVDAAALAALGSVPPPGSPAVAALGGVYHGHDLGAGCPTAQPFVEADQGAPLTYCVTVTNTGSLPLADVTLSASSLSVGFSLLDPSADRARLDPGSSVVFLAEATPPPDDADGSVDDTYVTTVSVSGVADGSDETVTASVDILAFPATDERPIAPEVTLAAGTCTAEDPPTDDDRTRCYTVTNTGNTHLDSIEIAGPGLAAAASQAGVDGEPLAPGAAAVIAVITVDAVDAGDPGAAVDPASVTVTANAVDSSGSDLVGLADVTASVAVSSASASAPADGSARSRVATGGSTPAGSARSFTEPAAEATGAAVHEPPTELAFTGWETTTVALLGIALMVGGAVLLHPELIGRVRVLAVGQADRPVRDYFDR